MNAKELHEKASEIFAEAVELNKEDRPQFLDKECQGNEVLQAEVRSLLSVYEKDYDVFEQPLTQIQNFFAQDEELQKQFGHYQIIRELGHGGMGVVYLAERADGQFEQQVAIKLMRHLSADKYLVQRFKDERQILAKLHHPNIAGLIDGGMADNGQSFLAMEYIDGVEIDKFCQENNLSLTERLKLFLKVCDGVAYAHRNLVIHRDIKPSNILVNRENEPKLLDFGLAKLQAENVDAKQTQTGFRLLTPAYASPEHLKGRTITTTSDIYSLGVVLYEILTGTRPFQTEGKSMEEIIQTVSESEPNAPSQVQSEISVTQKIDRDLDNIILMALRKEPERRYASAEQFAQDIKNYLEGNPVIARPNTFAYRAEKFFKRNKLSVSVAGLALLAIIGGLIAVIWQAEVARRQRDVAQAERDKAERINKFMQQMLSFSNQSLSSVSPVLRDKNVTVNEMLEQITPSIETELADQPDIQAKVLRTIGNSYASQGNYEKAEKNFRSALETQIKLYGEDNTETAETMTALGAISESQGKFAEANQFAEKAVNFYRKQQVEFPETSPFKLIQALGSYASIKYASLDVDSAKGIYEEAMKIASEANLKGQERESYAAIKLNFGDFLSGQGKIEEGGKLMREGIDLHNEISSKPVWEIGNAKTLLAKNLIHKGQVDEAYKLLADGEQILRETIGEKNIYFAGNLFEQARLLNQKKEFKASEIVARKALTLSEPFYHPDDPVIGMILTVLGYSVTQNGKLKEGEALFQRVLNILNHSSVKFPPVSVNLKLSFSDNLLKQNRLAEAEAMATEALAEIREYVNPRLGEDNASMKRVTDLLNKIHQKQGKK